MEDRFEAPGGRMPHFRLDWYVGEGGWPTRFRPVSGWRTWLRRGTAGGPLIGHATPPIAAVRIRDLTPVVTVPRCAITLSSAGFSVPIKRRRRSS